MKYCIGCIHLYYEPGRDAYCYSSWTSDSGSPPEFACQKGHWKAQLEEDFTQAKFQSAMESAETCADFSERPSVQHREQHSEKS